MQLQGVHGEPGPALTSISGRAEATPTAELYLTDHQRGHKSLPSPFQAVGSTKLDLSYPDTVQSPQARPGTLIRRQCKWANRMEPKLHCFRCFNLAKCYIGGRVLFGLF